jgi:hypothetical protein
LEQLQGSPLLSAVQNAKQQLEDDYKFIADKLFTVSLNFSRFKQKKRTESMLFVFFFELFVASQSRIYIRALLLGNANCGN